MLISKKKWAALVFAVFSLSLVGCNSAKATDFDPAKDLKKQLEISQNLREKELSENEKGVKGGLSFSIQTSSGSLFDYDVSFCKRNSDAYAEEKLLINGEEINNTYLQKNNEVFCLDETKTKIKDGLLCLSDDTQAFDVSEIFKVNSLDGASVLKEKDKNKFVLTMPKETINSFTKKTSEFFKNEKFKVNAEKNLKNQVKSQLFEMGLAKEDEKNADKIINEVVNQKLDKAIADLSNILTNSVYEAPNLTLYFNDDGLISKREISFSFEAADGFGELLGIDAEIPKEMTAILTLTENITEEITIDFSPLKNEN